MPDMLGLGVLLAVSAAADQPLPSNFALADAPAAKPVAAGPLRFQFESPKVDYSRPARPERKLGFLAAVEVAPGSLVGVGLSNRKARRSALIPEADRDGRRGGKKLAIKYVLSF